jgi:8-oxo-dGTP pyrophosphatase MutT (NUDIX family)
MVERTAGRLLIIDLFGRVLMINEAMQPGRPYWLVPGGGVEGGESPRQAAVREAHEETGLRLTLGTDAPEVLTERRSWTYSDTTYDQTNHFFAVRVEVAPELSASQLTELERDTFIGFRWWHPEEIDASPDMFYPAEIAKLVRDIVQRDGGELA